MTEAIEIETNNLWATAETLMERTAIKDRRLLDKLPIRKVRLSRKCVRYSVEDFEALIARRTIHATGEEEK